MNAPGPSRVVPRLKTARCALLGALLAGCAAPPAAPDVLLPEGPVPAYARCPRVESCPPGSACTPAHPDGFTGVCRAVCRTSSQCPGAPEGTAGLVPLCLADGLCALGCVDPASAVCPEGQGCSEHPGAVCR